MKRAILTTLAIFITLTALDILIHNVLLKETYEQTKHLWRTENEMKIGTMTAVRFILTLAFTTLFITTHKKRTYKTGLKFGILIGLITATPMGFGTYAYMPISFNLALAWFASNFISMTLAGLIVGSITTCIKD